MTEFGHTGIIGNGFCLDYWGAGPFEITAAGKTFRFEDSDQFGPSTIRKDGEITARQPLEKAPFWAAHRAWVKQGRRLEDDGITAIYDAPRPTIYRVIKGREIMIIEEGDEDGEMIKVKP